MACLLELEDDVLCSFSWNSKDTKINSVGIKMIKLLTVSFITSSTALGRLKLNFIFQTLVLLQLMKYVLLLIIKYEV